MPDGPNLKSKLARALKAKRTDDESYPHHDVDYYERFVQLDAYLNERIHPSVNQGATAADRDCAIQEATGTDCRRALWLTDHGLKHIETVIRRASDLAFVPEAVLSPYEMYILLAAIHFHDVGNIFGRDGHEQQMLKVMNALDRSVLGLSTPEQRLVQRIATAHGGYLDGVKTFNNKNTIEPLRTLSRNKTAGAQRQVVRAALLASILRFADELSEDNTRTERFLIDQKLINPESEVYHLYASNLEPIEIDSAEHIIDVHFDVNLHLVSNKFHKDKKRVYLIDEIFDRSLKMHHEHVYCSRFMEPFIHIAQINVVIVVCAEDYGKELDRIEYSMVPQGYPTSPRKLTDICPVLQGVTGLAVRKGTQVPSGDKPE